MKKIISIIIVALLMACESDANLNDKKGELAEKEKELASLENEVRKLRKEVAQLDTTADQRSLTPVSTTVLQQRIFEHFTELTGTVTSRENVLISAEASGAVTAIPVQEGQKVSAGQVLVRLENEAIANQLAEVKTSLELAEVTYQKRKNLWDQKIGSEIEYLQAKSNYESLKNRMAQMQAQYNKSFISSPISGTVDNIAVNKGELVSPGVAVVRVVDLDRVQVEAQISEEYLQDISRGDTVTVVIPALGIEQRVPVAFVGQVINPANRSFTVKVNLRNKDGIIKPNVLANIILRDYKNDNALVVPSIAVRKDLKGDFVYVTEQENGETIARKRHVKVGKSFNDLTEIMSGLEAGAEVVTTGFNQITAGAPVVIQ